VFELQDFQLQTKILARPQSMKLRTQKDGCLQENDTGAAKVY
jgi:hypothetical protein